jgi:hypothetical protein
MRTTCKAFREEVVNKHVLYVPCGCETERTRRFCKTHARAYREILTGILMLGGRRKPRRRIDR